MSPLQRRFVPQSRSAIRIESRADGQTPLIEGYGAVFYDGTPDTEYELYEGMVERVMPTAFDQAITDDDVRGLFNHDPSLLLGRTSSGTMRLSRDAKGLKYQIDAPDTQAGRDTATSIKRGDLTGSSFSFLARSVTWREEEGLVIRELNGVQLFDCGPVTFPAYEASTTSARSADIASAREEFDKWKDEQPAAKLARQLERDRATVRAAMIKMGLA